MSFHAKQSTTKSLEYVAAPCLHSWKLEINVQLVPQVDFQNRNSGCGESYVAKFVALSTLTSGSTWKMPIHANSLLPVSVIELMEWVLCSRFELQWPEAAF